MKLETSLYLLLLQERLLATWTQVRASTCSCTESKILPFSRWWFQYKSRSRTAKYSPVGPNFMFNATWTTGEKYLISVLHQRFPHYINIITDAGECSVLNNLNSVRDAFTTGTRRNEEETLHQQCSQKRPNNMPHLVGKYSC